MLQTVIVIPDFEVAGHSSVMAVITLPNMPWMEPTARVSIIRKKSTENNCGKIE